MIRFKENSNNIFKNFTNKQVNKTSPVLITGLIMVKNQEKHILDAINSLNKLCDHIIVVDTGSTDNTVKVIKNNFPKVQLERNKWIENYGLMRNITLNYIKKGWIFVLDSDELVLSDLTYEELHDFVSYLDKKYKNQDVSCTAKIKVKKSSEIFSRKRVLFRQSNSIKYNGLVHEELVSTSEKKLMTIDTNIDILNYGVYVKEMKKFNKNSRYSKLLLKQMNIEPENPRWVVMVSPFCVKHNIFPKKFYIDRLRHFIFINKIDNYEITNILKTPYLRYLLVRYFFVLHEDKKIDLAMKCIKFAMQEFPYDANILTLFSRLKLEILDSEEEYLFGKELLKLRLFKNHQELVHEASQGTENALDVVMVRLLMNLRKYKEAKQLLKTINNPIDKIDLKPEINLFKLKE